MMPQTVRPDTSIAPTHAAAPAGSLEASLWHPVAASAAVPAGQVCSVPLLEVSIVLWRSVAGVLHAWEDRCPHRGTPLSLGKVQGETLQCAYHGWSFDHEARCVAIPALPAFVPGAQQAARGYDVREQHELVWVRLGPPAEVPALSAPPAFEEGQDPRLKRVLCGPYEVATSAPRIVENFLDLAHFGFVHEGILGSLVHTQIPDYRVEMLPAAAGVVATDCRVWQPRSNIEATDGLPVTYGYKVVAPYCALLTKRPDNWAGFHEAIALFIRPDGNERSCVWFLLAMTVADASDAEMRAFQDTIFAQDKPIVESQQPRRLPLQQQAEAFCAADRLSAAYRRYLVALGVTFGTC